MVNFNLINLNNKLIPSKKHYSTHSLFKPVPLFTFRGLDNPLFLNLNRLKLKNKGGIYAFVNTVNDKKYIGSAKDFYIRLNDHLNRKSHSNSNLQKAFSKYGLNKFDFVIYEFYSYETRSISEKTLTNLESKYINFFDHSTLYNFRKNATSLLGYKHSPEAIQKMIN